MYNYGLLRLGLSNCIKKKHQLKAFKFTFNYYKNAINWFKCLNNAFKHGLYIFRRKAYIPMSQLGCEVFIYNGATFNKIRINLRKIGRKYGEFCFTKKMGKSIHVTKKDKRRKK